MVRRRSGARVAGAVAGLLGLVTLAAARGPAAATRDVVFVANAEGGTVSIVDARTFRVVRELDVLPDGEEATLGEDDPVQALGGQRLVEAAGGDNFAQDQDVSPDGRTLYVSRGHRGDVAAFDIATGDLLWKTPISGVRADHMTISHDGRRLYVSALTADRVEVLDTAGGAVVGSFRAGEWPHDLHVSHDGELVYNGSIGNIIVPWEVREQRPAADPVLPPPYQLTVANADSLKVVRTYEFPRGIRPYVVSDDGTRLYAQLSEFHGLVEYDLVEGRMLRVLDLPVDEGVTEDDYSFEAPHHGLAVSPDGSTLCAAGRASDYVALVATSSMEPIAVVDVGDAPSWAATSPDGRSCFVANTRDDTVSVVSYGRGVEVARIAVGDGPKHLEAASLPRDVVRGTGAGR